MAPDSTIIIMDALSPCDFRLASLMRLGCQMRLASGQCDCGKELDSDGYHLITCKTGGCPVISHNNMVSAWSDCLSQLQLHHVKEPRERYVNSEDR